MCLGNVPGLTGVVMINESAIYESMSMDQWKMSRDFVTISIKWGVLPLFLEK